PTPGAPATEDAATRQNALWLPDAPADVRSPDGLPPLPPVDENLFAVHYSCELLANCPAQTPPVSAIVVEHVLTGHQAPFAAFLIAERTHIPSPEFLTRLPDLERELLRSFYGFVAAHPRAVWLHFGMKSVRFGFEVLAQRARILGLEPSDIPTDRR